MTTKADWIYCRLVDRGSFIFPRKPFWIGQVEFSDRGEAEVACERALVESMGAYAVSETGDGWERLVRARLLLPGLDDEGVRRFGSFHLAETLQAFNAHLTFGMSELRATEAGYIVDLKSRVAAPLLPPLSARERFGIMAMSDEVAHHPLHILNTLYVAPKAFGELGDAFRRSSHWRSLASSAGDEGESLLLYWMAAECLCKVRHDEEITSKLLAAAGFPTGGIAKRLDSLTARSLTKLPNHRAWRRSLSDVFNALRIARNRIVHSGFRHVDLPTVLRGDQHKLGMFVLPLVAKSLSEMALQALNLQHRTITEMWERYAVVLDPSGPARHAQWFIERLESAS